MQQTGKEDKLLKKEAVKLGILIGIIWCICGVVEPAYGLDKLKLAEVKTEVFKDLTKMIDDNVALFCTFIATAGAAIAQGDLRTRAQGAGIGMATAMLVWAMAKKAVGI